MPTAGSAETVALRPDSRQAGPPGLAAALKCPGPINTTRITVVAKDYNGMLDQPKNPIKKGGLIQIYVEKEAYGGPDKHPNGHRYDTAPIVNGMINAGMSCQPIHYKHQEHQRFFEVCRGFDFIIIRCMPGQIAADGGDQQKFDDGVRGLMADGKHVWPSPDVMEKMGAKDALCKVAKTKIGVGDTVAYYSPQDFSSGFRKTMAFQPRVISRSFGEGI